MVSRYFFLIYPLLYLITLSLGILNYNKIRASLYLKLFLIFIAYSLLTEILGFIIGVVYRINTFAIFNIWNFVNHFFYLFFFLHLLQNSFKKNVVKFIIVSYTVFTLVVVFYADFLNKFLSIDAVIGSILIVITVLIYFSELLQSDEIFNLKKSMVFWISLSVLLFNIGFIPVDIIAEFISFSGVFRIIALILNLLMLACFITGFIVSKKEFNV